MADMEEVYNVKKRDYDNIVSGMAQEMEVITKDMGSNFTEYREQETKFHSNNVQADIFDTF